MYDNFLIGSDDSIKDFMKNQWKNELLNTRSLIQIKTYYKILNDFTCECCFWKNRQNELKGFVITLISTSFENLKTIDLVYKQNNQDNSYFELSIRKECFYSYKTDNGLIGLVGITTGQKTDANLIYLKLNKKFKFRESYSEKKIIHDTGLLKYGKSKIDFSKSYINYYSSNYTEPLISKKVNKINGDQAL